MLRLTKEQRDRILTIGIGAVIVVVGLWFALIGPQRDALAASRKRTADVQAKLKDAMLLVQKSADYQQSYEAGKAELDLIESGMGSGDLYFWIISTLTSFKSPYAVDIPHFFPPETGKVGLLPGFPYQAATFKIDGTAFYHDLGKFIANFENRFPYMRVQNLDFSPASASDSTVPEKLRFTMQIVALIKPGPQR